MKSTQNSYLIAAGQPHLLTDSFSGHIYLLNAIARWFLETRASWKDWDVGWQPTKTKIFTI